MKTRMREADLLNHVWGLKACGQRDDAIKAAETRFWNKWWHNKYSEYVPAFGWYFLMMSYLSFSELSYNSSSWKHMSVHVVFCYIFWNLHTFWKCLYGNTMKDRMSGSDGWRRTISSRSVSSRANHRVSVTLLKLWQNIFMALIEKQKYTCC